MLPISLPFHLPPGMLSYIIHFKKCILLFCVCAMLMLCMAMQHYCYPTMDDITIDRDGQAAGAPAMLPAFENYSSQLHVGLIYSEPGQTKKFRVFSGGCIERITVDEKILPFDRSSLCDMFAGGITVDLGEVEIPGTSVLNIYTAGTIDRHIIHLEPLAPDTTLFHVLSCGLWLLASAILLLLMHGVMGEWLTGGILWGAASIFLYRFMHTNFLQYTTDMPWHMHYIMYILNNWSIPAPRDGWSYYHPATYYALEAIILKIGNWMGGFDTTNLVRLSSMVFFIVFLAISAVTLKGWLQDRRAYYMAFTLFAFYPTGMLFSSRIDSHMLYYPLYAATFHYLLKWLDEKGYKNLWIALSLFGLCLGTRSNAYLLAPLFIIALLYKYWKKALVREGLLACRPYIVMTAALLLLGVALNPGRMLYYQYFVYKDFREGNVEMLPAALRIDNKPISKFFVLNTNDYFNEPFWDAWNDKGGRQFFPNSFLKSSLFGDFQMEHRELAKFLCTALLWMILYSACSMAIDWRHYASKRIWWICVMPLLVGILALMRGRLTFPYASTQDFRYIYPATLGCAAMLGMIFERYTSQKYCFLAAVTAITMLVFTGSSIAFYVML